MDDQDIIRLFFNREESAISETDLKYGKKLFRFAMNLLTCREDAEECRNDTYLETWNTIPPNRPVNFLAYLMRICRCDAFDRIEQKTAKKRNSVVVELTFEMAETLPDNKLQTEIGELEMGQILSAFLSSLPSEKRMLFIKRYWFGASIRELSAQYGMSKSNIKTQLYRTRNSLRDYLRKEGIYYE